MVILPIKLIVYTKESQCIFHQKYRVIFRLFFSDDKYFKSIAMSQLEHQGDKFLPHELLVFNIFNGTLHSPLLL